MTNTQEQRTVRQPPLMNGWHFTSEDYQRAWQEGKLVTAQIENALYCNLDCTYCFRGGARPHAKQMLEEELPREKLLQAIDEMAGLGVRAINIIGAGEPLLDPDLGTLLRHIAQYSITPVIATNGSRITPGLVDVLQECDASVVVKMNTFNAGLQDALAQRRGYAARRDAGLKLLMEAGFNQPGEGYQTRLGINSIVFQGNKGEVLDILRYCRSNNIMPIMATFIPAGRTAEKTDQEVPREEFMDISRRARMMDLEEFGISYERLLPYLGGVPCTQCGKSSLYLTIAGEIYECPGQLHHYGNSKDTTITEAFKRIRTEQDNQELTCPARLDYWQRTEQ